MAHYLVKARYEEEKLPELRERLDSGEIRSMRPFGIALHDGLDNARVDAPGWAVWEEEDYCSPPLAMERAAVLDTYFVDLGVEPVKKNEGWAEIDELPRLWENE